MGEKIYLNACPFCFGDAVLEPLYIDREPHGWNAGWYRVKCKECGIVTPYGRLHEVIRLWNARPKRKEMWEHIKRRLQEISAENPYFSFSVEAEDLLAGVGASDRAVSFKSGGIDRTERECRAGKGKDDQKKDIILSIAHISHNFPKVYMVTHLWLGRWNEMNKSDDRELVIFSGGEIIERKAEK